MLEASGGTGETAALIDSKLSTITNASSDHDASCIDRVFGCPAAAVDPRTAGLIRTPRAS